MGRFNKDELQLGEVYVGNVNVTQGVKLPVHLSELKTARIGDVALGIQGKPLPRNYMRPLFVHRLERQKYLELKESQIKATAV